MKEDTKTYDISSSNLHSKLFLVDPDKDKTEYVPLAEDDLDASQALVKLIALYLPQFHPIPENDGWWGKGFTEWTNVRKAVPNFIDHYQPRIPGDLGYYDLRDVEVQKRQIQLAKKYGIYGFCFYYYWFSGKRLLERPLDQFVENTDLDFHFCICWANENWTRRWDGREDDILIGQTHTENDYMAFIRDVAPILGDKRYIRIDGRPLLIVYHLTLLPDPQRAAEIWREECRQAGIGEIYLAAIQSFGLEDPKPYGFDATIEFPPHNCLEGIAMVDQSNLQITNPDFVGEVFEYRVAAQLVMNHPVPTYTKFRTVMPSWDNTARRQNTGVTFINSTPSAYRSWLAKAVEYTRRNLSEDKRFIFINAWNEWGESAYLEPDQRYGYAYLQATKEAVRNMDLLDIEQRLNLLETQLSGSEHAVQSLVIQIAEQEQEINILKSQLTERDKKIDERDKKIDEKDKKIEATSRALETTAAAMDAMSNSYTWKVGIFFHDIWCKLIPSKQKRSKIKRLFR